VRIFTAESCKPGCSENSSLAEPRSVEYASYRIIAANSFKGKTSTIGSGAERERARRPGVCEAPAHASWHIGRSSFYRSSHEGWRRTTSQPSLVVRISRDGRRRMQVFRSGLDRTNEFVILQ